MISKLITTLKDPARLSLVVSMFFFAGILASAYIMATLTHDMIFSQAIDVYSMALAQGVFMKLYIVIGLTFVIGVTALNVSSRAKKEIIVYRDKKIDANDTRDQQVNADGELESINTTSFRVAIQQMKKEEDLLQEGLNIICKQIDAVQGAFYQVNHKNGNRVLEMKHGYAFSTGENTSLQFELGEGLVGQAAATGKSVYIDEVPQGYINALSGLGTASPNNLLIVALKKDNEIKGVLELATFATLKEKVRKQVEEMGQVLVENF